MVGMVIQLGISSATALLGHRKGYNPIIWFLAGSILGLIALAFLPYANKEALPEEKRRSLKNTGNWVGVGMAVLGIGLAIVIVSSQ